MPAIAVQSREHGPVTIPLSSVRIVRKGTDGTAVVVLSDGHEMPTRDEYAKLSGRMTSVNVWGHFNE